MTEKKALGRPQRYEERTRVISVRIPETIWRWYRAIDPRVVQMILIKKFEEFNSNRRGENNE